MQVGFFFFHFTIKDFKSLCDFRYSDGTLRPNCSPISTYTRCNKGQGGRWWLFCSYLEEQLAMIWSRLLFQLLCWVVGVLSPCKMRGACDELPGSQSSFNPWMAFLCWQSSARYFWLGRNHPVSKSMEWVEVKSVRVTTRVVLHHSYKLLL